MEKEERSKRFSSKNLISNNGDFGISQTHTELKIEFLSIWSNDISRLHSYMEFCLSLFSSPRKLTKKCDIFEIRMPIKINCRIHARRKQLQYNIKEIETCLRNQCSYEIGEIDPLLQQSMNSSLLKFTFQTQCHVK